MVTGVRRLTFRFTTTAAGLAALAALAFLYQREPDRYYDVVQFMGIGPYRYPFLDLQFILASVDCWQRGIDVYVENPCDVLNRLFAYSPVWLRFSILPGNDWTNLLGIFLSVSFFLALAVLPQPRSTKELLLRLIATLSPVTTYAVERGNIDLLIFVMATGAGVLSLKSVRGRVAAYAIFVMAGLLKFYPLVLMVLTLHERPRVFWWISGVAAAVVAATGVYFDAELVRALSNIEASAFFTSAFGAHFLPDAIAEIVNRALHPEPSLLRLVRLVMFAVLLLTMVGWFFFMVGWQNFRIAIARLPEPDKIFLLIGAMLIAGCFFAGSNEAYRGIYLLFTLPGLFAMARKADDLRVRKAAVHGYLLVVVLTWAGFFLESGLLWRFLVSQIGGGASSVLLRCLWLVSQIAWWQVATLFVAILIGCCSNWLEADPEWRRFSVPLKSLDNPPPRELENR